MLTLYHAPMSRSSRIVWLLEEVGAPYEIAYVDIPRMDGSGAPDPANPHPDKKVPALDDDGELITESAAIAIHLADRFPEAGLLPRPGEPGRGTALGWIVYYVAVIEPVVGFRFMGLEHEGLRRNFRGPEEYHRRVRDALAAHDWIAGPRFTAADPFIGSLGQWMRDALPREPAVDAYLARCAERPALVAAQAKDAP